MAESETSKALPVALGSFRNLEVFYNEWQDNLQGVHFVMMCQHSCSEHYV